MIVPSKIYLACAKKHIDKRFECVYFSEKYAYATNGAILVRQSIDMFGFMKDEKQIISGKYIHRDVYSMFTDVYGLWVTQEGIKCLVNRSNIILYPFENSIIDCPLNYENNIYKDYAPVEKTGINPKLFYKLGRAMCTVSWLDFRLHFSGHDKPIKVLTEGLDEQEQVGLIMPVYKSDE